MRSVLFHNTLPPVLDAQHTYVAISQLLTHILQLGLQR